MLRKLFKFTKAWPVLKVNGFPRFCSLPFSSKNFSNQQTFVKATNAATDELNKNANNINELNPEECEQRLKVLQLELDIARQEGRRVPDLMFLKKNHWDYILTLQSKSARLKYYAYLWQVQIRKENRKRLKEEKAASGEECKNKVLQERAANDHIIYGLGHVSMFLRIYDAAINHWMNCRLIRAMQFSPKIVLDCSYDDCMNKREAENTAKQLMLCFAENRAHDDPFDMHYCNVNLESICMKSLQRFVPTMLNPEFPLNVHTKCFTELFPKENLVYLTPHCRTDLQHYNPDDIYIIGAVVDLVNNNPVSLAKAKRLGLRMARLPLDQYLEWGSGSGKSLTLNQVTNILLDLKKSNDWVTALKHVPRRKLVDLSQESEKLRNLYNKRPIRFNKHKDEIMSDNTSSKISQPINSVRCYKDDFKFNLETWGSKKKRGLV